jgi:chemotaxis signal transduction protein
LATEETTPSILNNVTGLDHFDPFQGFVDDGAVLNIRYGFRLGKINFLVNQFSMSEVVTKPVIYPIPNTPSWIQGLINLRGILVPVFDIKKRIGQNNNDENKKKDILLVLDKGERAFATFIDALPDSINIDEVELKETDIPNDIHEILKEHVTEAFELNEEVWFEINYETFVKNMTREYSDTNPE